MPLQPNPRTSLERIQSDLKNSADVHTMHACVVELVLLGTEIVEELEAEFVALIDTAKSSAA